MTVGSLSLQQFQTFTVSPISPAPVFTQCPPSLHNLNSFEEFKQTHAHYIKLGLSSIPRLAGELLSACGLSHWGSLEYARAIFAELDEPNTYDYNTMIRAHIKFSEQIAAVELYRNMLERGVEPDNFTLPFTLKACSQLVVLAEGIQVHGQALKLGFEDDVFVGSSLISLYGKCKDIAAACRVFELMGENKSVASWSAILAAHNRMGLWSDCLNLFVEMTGSGLRADESSLVSTLSSCAHLGSLGAGRSVHCSLIRNFTGLNVIVQTSLVDMYIKCGYLEKGLAIFNHMEEKNKWAYSAVISGLAMHGDGRRALEIFSSMIKDGIEPDEAVYVGVLSACSRAGLIEEGLQCFDKMQLKHQIVPTAEHYGCLVDLMGRAGKLDDALLLIRTMPDGLLTVVAWRSLLSTCKVHDNLEMAECAVRNLVELHCANPGDFVILSNMYAKVGRWDDAARTRREMTNIGLKQVPGFSSVEVNGKLHTFVSMDKFHPRCEEVYEMLYQMQWQLKFEGYKPDTSETLLHNVGEEQKLEVLNGHSQKLAIAFGLLNTSKGDSIRIITNIRMSSECHAYTRLVAKIFEREIVVRDRYRFHRFRRGVCSCRDYW